MGLALILSGIVLLVAAARNTQGDLMALVRGDLLGDSNDQGGFIQWMIALGLVGVIGFIPRLKPVSVALLALILISIFLRRGKGFFSQIQAAGGITNG